MFGNVFEKAQSRNYDEELWDTKVFERAKEDPKIERRGAVYYLTPTHISKCVHHNHASSLADMPYSAKLAAHTGVFQAGCM